MPRIYFHLCDHLDVILDEEGADVELAAIPARALRIARELICHDAISGKINFGYSIEARDGLGKTLHTLDFQDAVEVLGYFPAE